MGSCRFPSPGEKYMAEQPDVSVAKLPALWDKHRVDMLQAYHGVCAYLAVRFVGAEVRSEWLEKTMSIPDEKEKQWQLFAS